MSGSTTATLSAQDQNFLLTDTENKYAESQIDSLATTAAGSSTVAELGRWFGADYGRLIGTNIAAAKEVNGQVPSGPGTSEVASITNLTPLTGTAFDSAYLTDVIALKGMDTMGGATEIASGTNPLLVQVATASNSLVTEHLQEAAYAQAVLAGTTPPAVSPSMAVAGPPLAPNTALNAQDQTFITNATQGGLTAIQEGELALSPTLSPDLSVQEYGYWQRCENSQLGVNIAALAAAEKGVVPTTLTSAQSIQVATLQTFTGTLFEGVFAADQVSNDQVLGNLIRSEIAGGSDTALVALAQAVLVPAEQLLAQAVIESVQVGGGFTDASIAPNTLVGAVVTNIAEAAGTGSLTIGNVSTGAASLPAGTAGVLLVDVAGETVTAPGGYSDILDIAGPETITGGMGATNTVVGAASGVTYYGTTGSAGLLLLDGGSSLVLGAGTGAGNYTVIGSNAGDNTIFAGSGNDVIATGTGASLVGLGSGINTVTAQGNDTVMSSTGNDVVYGAGTATALFAGTGNLIFVGASGTASVVTGTTATVLFGGAGGSVDLFGAANGNILAAAGGNETLQGGAATGNNVFFGGSGSDALVGGTGNDIFVAGAGSTVFTGGGGNNTFEFVSGATAGATDFITDFGGSSGNRILLAGYTGSTASALSTETVSGGNTTITLADTTKVQFLGVSNLTATSFD